MKFYDISSRAHVQWGENIKFIVFFYTLSNSWLNCFFFSFYKTSISTFSFGSSLILMRKSGISSQIRPKIGIASEKYSLFPYCTCRFSGGGTLLSMCSLWPPFLWELKKEKDGKYSSRNKQMWQNADKNGDFVVKSKVVTWMLDTAG